MCKITHDGDVYLFDGNDCVDYKESGLPKDGFEDFDDMDYRPLMERSVGLLHHEQLLKLQGGKKGVCYAAAHACAVIWENAGMEWEDFLKYVQTADLLDLVNEAKQYD